MSDISKIDANFAASDCIKGGDFISIDEAPFKIYGLIKDENGYCRVPQSVADNTNEGTALLNRDLAGGIVRFATNSPTLAVKAENPVVCNVMPHMAVLGSCGFTAFERKRFLASFRPGIPVNGVLEEKTLAYDEKGIFPDGFHEITLYLPLYGGYKDISLKVAKGCEIRPAKPFKNEKPVVFYGSSITQGGCASTSANAFTNMISRDMDLYCINLGFSGSSRGETAMAEYIASLEMSVFVMDYDHNAPSAEHLEATHKKFFETIRAKHPELPIIIATSIPDIGWKDEYYARRRNVIYATYKAAKESGDNNVYFLNGEDFFNSDIPFDDCTVDGCHPNDIGMFMMKKGFEKVLEKLNI